jgi:phytoene dehydrogenase-like protein
MTDHVTVVGGGLGGLVAAVAAREAGFAVTLHEAHRELGGRARPAATTGPTGVPTSSTATAPRGPSSPSASSPPGSGAPR